MSAAPEPIPLLVRSHRIGGESSPIRREVRARSRVTPSARALRLADPEEVDPDDAPALAHALTEEAPPPTEDRRVVPFGYTPHRKQLALHSLRRLVRRVNGAEVIGWRYRVAVCGRRGGKTVGGAADFASAMFDDWLDKVLGRGRFAAWGPQQWNPAEARDRDAIPFLYYWIIAPTYSLLEEPKSQLHKALGGYVRDGGVIAHKDHSRGVWWLVGGIRVDFRSADRPALLVGRGVHGLWIDEAARIKPEVWHDHLPAVLADFRGWALFTSTPIGRNWLWELWCKGDPSEAAALADGGDVREVLDPEWACVRWGSADNTAVPGLAEEAERMRKVLPEAMWLRNFAASFHAFIGQCFPMLNASEHLKPEVSWSPHTLVEVAAGFDWGWSHKGALAVVGRDRYGKWHELETVARTGLLPHSERGESWTRIAGELRERWQFDRVYVSPERPETAEYFRRAGIPAERAFDANLEGLDWLRAALHTGELDFRSGNAYRSFESLKHPDGGARAELWLKEGDDEFDAVRYALSRPIERGNVRAINNAGRYVNPLRR